MDGKTAAGELWRVVGDLRELAVWRHEIDGVNQDGKIRPFFVAVEPNWYRFENFRARIEQIDRALEQAGRPTKWVPKVINEHFDRIGYNANTAWNTELLKMQPQGLWLVWRSEQRFDKKPKTPFAPEALFAPEGLDSPRVQPALTETKASPDPQELAKAIEDFKNMGVHLSFEQRIYKEYEVLEFTLQSPKPLRRTKAAGLKFRMWGYPSSSDKQMQIGGGAILVRGVGEVYNADRPRRQRPREKGVSFLGWEYKYADSAGE